MPVQQPAFKRTHFQAIGSTQDYFTENAAALLSGTNQVVVTATEQTKGRGTANRIWASPPEVNIYATFGIKIPNEFMVYFDLAKSPLVMEVMALAVVKTLEEFGFKPTIKWRNDVLLNGKKICGILCEAVVTPQGGVGLIGIGLNVNMPKEICDGLEQPVTSMAVEAGFAFDKEQVFNCLANNVAHYVKLYTEKNFGGCISEINARLAFVGKLIHVEDQFSKQVIEGVCLGVDELGQLKIKKDDGSIQLVKWGRIIKDELTYPEAFVKKQKEETRLTTNKLSSIAYAIGILGLGGLAYLQYNNYKANSPIPSPIASKKSSTPNATKQEPGKRHFSTSSQSFSLVQFPRKSIIAKPKFVHIKPINASFFKAQHINHLRKTNQLVCQSLKRILMAGR